MPYLVGLVSSSTSYNLITVITVSITVNGVEGETRLAYIDTPWA
jgi:hypothetical protein